MAVTLTEMRANHVQNLSAKRGKGVGLRFGVRTSGCSGMAYKLEFADEVPDSAMPVHQPWRHGAGRSEKPALYRRHGTGLHARRFERGLQVQQPEREERVRLRRIV